MSYLYFMNKCNMFAAFCDYRLFTNCAGVSLAKKEEREKEGMLLNSSNSYSK